MALAIVPITFSRAQTFVAQHHRHHAPPVGNKFTIAVADDGELVGVLIAGRPLARNFDDGYTVEVTRSATDGTFNANSMLYGAARQIAKAMGYRRIITYTREDESGASLRASGWIKAAVLDARAGWSTPSRLRADDSTQHNVERVRWEVVFAGVEGERNDFCFHDRPAKSADADDQLGFDF